MSKRHGDQTLEKIKSYLTSPEGTVYLNDKEEDLLNKVIMAHHLFQSRKYGTFQMIRLLAKCYSISEASAQVIMHDAQIIFGAIKVYDRTYMASLHLDEIIADMVKARESGNDSMLMELHKLKNKAIDLLPIENSTKDTPPAIINYNIFASTINRPAVDLKAALIKGRQLLEEMQNPDYKIPELHDREEL
ncbi:hypothetical protein [Chitinophaga ginsengisegetis]|uniref:hypothetical protein n=1 Tax=Chitinophaga ginsengisegetis TaxID=393003 RepID=UPI000DBA3B3A|nr:hypothetical protein [Chitinophaga ginsengisegetis]MDR6565452.1 hypothetical protein [Chitinophaga ginsengisegetis]MDR6645180.1 hypothetical protein [Chitinophaga ginsengisegetis]MDR6652228.1 hypothetical protein [Chitinophaga ginsengisegetis]